MQTKSTKAISIRTDLTALWASVILLTSCTHPTPTAKTPTGTITSQPSTTRSPAMPSSTSVPALPDMIIHAHRRGKTPVSIVVVQGTRKLYTITADSNETERTTDGHYFSSFQQPVITFFNRDRTHMLATATKADVDGTSKVVTMVGKVIFRAQDGTTLRSERLTYDSGRDRVESWSGVLVTTRLGDTLRGEHLVGDLHLQHVHLDGAEQP